jgi:4-hydroxybenzoate polyprenyltransferase
MRAIQVLSHIFLAVCQYNLIVFGFMQIDEWGTAPLWCLFVFVGSFGLGFQVRSVLSFKGETK